MLAYVACNALSVNSVFNSFECYEPGVELLDEQQTGMLENKRQQISRVRISISSATIVTYDVAEYLLLMGTVRKLLLLFLVKKILHTIGTMYDLVKIQILIDEIIRRMEATQHSRPIESKSTIQYGEILR
ncbi:hypothetical protein V1478_005703, partial [Vespula squamosa]